MQARLDLQKIADPQAVKAVMAVQAFLNNHSRLEPSLLNLVWLRASQINGCAWCIDMHTKDARALGETEQRLYALNAGGTLLFTASGNGPRWRGRNPLRWWPKPMFRMTFMKRRRSISAIRSWLI